MPALAHLDRASGRRIRRYERAAPAELVHVDIKTWQHPRRQLAHDELVHFAVPVR
jgi:hypothetical protein